MPGVVRSKIVQEQADLRSAQKLKPRLRQFVIEQQTQQAAKNVQAEQEREKKILAMQQQFTEVVKRARVLSLQAFIVQKLWLSYPPAVEMRWLTSAGYSQALAQEKDLDMWG